MEPRAKRMQSSESDYERRDVLADVLDSTSGSVAPEVAAKRAANRIIQALRETEKNDRRASETT